MYNDDRFKAVLQMIHVTPENYKSLNANMILYLYEVVAEAEKLCEGPSAYENMRAEQKRKTVAP